MERPINKANCAYGDICRIIPYRHSIVTPLFQGLEKIGVSVANIIALPGVIQIIVLQLVRHRGLKQDTQSNLLVAIEQGCSTQPFNVKY